MKRIIKNISLILLLVVSNACTISYSFTGASISPDVKSFTIYNFPNRARNVNPTLGDDFMDELRKKFNRQTSLNYNENGGDLEFEGSITDYDVKPLSVRDAEQDAMNRLTVRFQVKFTNNKNHDQDFDTTFEASSDFTSDNNLADVEATLVKLILEQIVDDVFNKSVANW